MESPWKGLSGMDAARAVMGQGWPFVGGPHPVVPLERWWNEGTPAQAGPYAGVPFSVGYFLLGKQELRSAAK